MEPSERASHLCGAILDRVRDAGKDGIECGIGKANQGRSSGVKERRPAWTPKRQILLSNKSSICLPLETLNL